MKIPWYVVIALALTLIPFQAHAASYYVDPIHGNDSNGGGSPTTAFRTLQKAADNTHPGDTVYAMAGTYTDTNDPNVVNITRSGTRTQSITYTNYHGQTSVVQLSNNNWSGINISGGAQYIVINGFEVAGTNQSLTWSGANSARDSGLGNPMYNGTGINCAGAWDSSAKVMTPVAHITIQNCRIHDCAEEGIGSEHCDYLTIQNNTIWNCSWYSPYCGSGISTWEDTAVDSNTTTYKMIICGNRVYNCRAIVGCGIGLPYSITDGNGIIIDGDGSSTNGVAYTGKILIANNLVYDCGGRGINLNTAHNIDVFNNTLYHNAGARSHADTLIAAGGTGAAPFAADSGFSGGSADTPWTGPVDTSLVTTDAPAPQAVYQSERAGSTAEGFTYTIREQPLHSYRIVLLFTEDRWNAPNERQFNVSVNGNTWLTNFDIYAAAGAMHKAVEEERTDTSDPNGDITIAFTPGKYDAPKVDGIEILSDYYTPNGEISIGGGPHSISVNCRCYNNIIYPSAGNPAIEQYNVDSSDVVCGYNLYYDGTGNHPATPFADTHALWSAPKFIAPGDSGAANFHLKTGSPAIGSGTANPTLSTELLGAAHRHGDPIDRGCYQK